MYDLSDLRPPTAYVSSACRVHDHETCLSGPIALCPCWCHGMPIPPADPDDVPD